MRWWMRLSMASVVAAILVGLGPGRPAAAQSGAQSRDLTTYGIIGEVKTDGRLAVWSVNGDDLVMADLSTGTMETLAENAGVGIHYRISEGRVAWIQDDGLHIYAASSGATSVMALPAGFGHFDLHGDTLVWFQQDGTPAAPVQSLWVRNIATGGAAKQVFSRAGSRFSGSYVQTNGTIAVWAQGVGEGERQSVIYELQMAPLDGSSAPETVDAGPPSGMLGGFVLSDNTLFYVGAGLILYQHPLGGIPVALSNADVYSANLRVSGNYLIGSEPVKLADGSSTFEDWIYDLRNQRRWFIRRNAEFIPMLTSMNIGGEVVVWSDDTFRNHIVRIRRIADTAPPAPRAAADPLLQGRSYDAASRHSLGGRFEQYWGRNGGAALFGAPLTEEFRQQSSDTGDPYEVQYFEKQRYEYHPEHAGTPYEIQLGRLGAELLEQSGRDWWAEGGDQPGAQPLPGECQAFAAPDRTVCGAFLDYWRSHGLDLGKPGISYDESLALFGQPLTAPRLETNPDGDTVLTQWFERARFEWHPGNPAEYQVLLGRLAAEQLPAFGW
jgi:hypothetical protein